MNLERFTAIVDAYGADAARWPENERAGARALLAADPRARAILSQAVELDQLLDLAPSHLPSAALTGRILASLPPPRLGWRALLADILPGRNVWQPTAGLAFALVMGIGVGVLWPVSAPFTPGAEGQGITIAEDDSLFFNESFDLEDDLEDEDQS